MSGELRRSVTFENKFLLIEARDRSDRITGRNRVVQWTFDSDFFWKEFIGDKPWKAWDSLRVHRAQCDDYRNYTIEEKGETFAGTILGGLVSYRLSTGHLPPDEEAWTERLELEGPSEYIEHVAEMIKIWSRWDESEKGCMSAIKEIKSLWKKKKLME